MVDHISKTPVGRDWSKAKRQQTEACSFRMLPSTAQRWLWFTERSDKTPSAVANALVRDLVNDRLEFRQGSAVLEIIMASALSEHYQEDKPPPKE